MTTKIKQMKVREAFAKFAIGKIKEQEARSLGVEFNGGRVLIPTLVANEIISHVNGENLMRRYGEVVTESNGLRYPVLVNGITVDGHTSERSNNEMVVNHLGLKAVLLEPVEFDVLVGIRKKFIATSGAGIVEGVINIIKETYLQKEIDYMYNGYQSDSFNTGSLYNMAKRFIPKSNEAALAVVELKNEPSTKVVNKARWIVNKKALEVAEGLRYLSGKEMLTTIDNNVSGAQYSFLGFPLDCTDDLKSEDDKALFYFGNFNSFKIQENNIDSLEIELKYELLAQYNEIGFKLYNLIDGKLIFSDLEPTVYLWEF